MKVGSLPASIVKRITPLPQTSIGSASYESVPRSYSTFMSERGCQTYGRHFSNLRRDVWQATASLVQYARLAGFFDFVYGTKAKVADLERSCCVEEEVFWLEISMAHAFFVEV